MLIFQSNLVQSNKLNRKNSFEAPKDVPKNISLTPQIVSHKQEKIHKTKLPRTLINPNVSIIKYLQTFNDWGGCNATKNVTLPSREQPKLTASLIFKKENAKNEEEKDRRNSVGININVENPKLDIESFPKPKNFKEDDPKNLEENKKVEDKMPFEGLSSGNGNRCVTRNLSVGDNVFGYTDQNWIGTPIMKKVKLNTILTSTTIQKKTKFDLSNNKVTNQEETKRKIKKSSTLLQGSDCVEITDNAENNEEIGGYSDGVDDGVKEGDGELSSGFGHPKLAFQGEDNKVQELHIPILIIVECILMVKYIQFRY